MSGSADIGIGTAADTHGGPDIGLARRVDARPGWRRPGNIAADDISSGAATGGNANALAGLL